jgi:UDP-3-O-[3-hydroxymyristoyl] glucosamine N-acyltransferase
MLAERIGARLIGNGATEVATCAPIDRAESDQVTFLANSKYNKYLATTRAAAVILHHQTPCPKHVTRLEADDPYFAFRNAMIELHGSRRHPVPIGDTVHGISTLASVHPDATVGDGTVVHPHAVVERGASVGRGCVLYPGAYVGPDAVIGDECCLFPNAVVYDRCVVGSRVTLHANTVVGHDGFGYATHQGTHHKIPQAGTVIIEDDVEIGAGCAIERAAIGETRVGKGTKLADLISIGHGTTIGSNCLLVSLVGVSGSVEIGDYVVLGGQVGVTGHLRIGDQVQAAGKAAITDDVPPGMKVGGVPAIELDQAKRNALVGTDLYGLARRVRQLERELEKLKGAEKPRIDVEGKPKRSRGRSAVGGSRRAGGTIP